MPESITIDEIVHMGTNERGMIHWYPRNPAYRLSGMSPPQIGDIARCGHRKAVPHHPGSENLPVECVVCFNLSAR